MGSRRRLAVIALASSAACSSTESGLPDDQPLPDDLPEDTRAVIEIYPLDLWAQPLGEGAVLEVARDGAVVETLGGQVAFVPLTEAGAYTVSLTAPDHEPIELAISFDGSGELDGTRIGAAPVGAGVSVSHEIRDDLPVHTLYLGLRHRWFSAEGRPARRGNQIDFMMDGEEAWGAVAEELSAASDQVLFASWWFESDFAVVRDGTPGNTIMERLDSSDATKRVLIGQFWGQDSILSGVNVDDALIARGETGGDGFEFMGQANETEGVFRFELPGFAFGDRVRAAHGETADRSFDDEAAIESRVSPREVDLTDWPVTLEVQHASWHQKFAVVDDVAFVGGMNAKDTDWDSSEHLVEDPRRTEGPRKDYMVRIDGPAVQDVADVFHARWELAREAGADFAENATSFEVPRDMGERSGGVQAQITTTMPDPLWEHSILESWLNAVAQAEHYIFIEDQYWRAPLLNEAIVARMREVPGLQLVVITKPINEWTDPGCAWTYRTDAQLEAALGARYTLLQLRSFAAVDVGWGWDETESRFVDIDVHSKLLIVDDVFLSVGSANKNNRGVIYEGEMNVAVLDRTWVRDARRRVIANLLPPGAPASDEAAVWIDQLIDAAAANDVVRARWEVEGDDISLDGAPLPAEYQPRGFVYNLDFPSVDECLMEDVGPDMT